MATDALAAIWAHEGSLAEEVRARRIKLTPAIYAVASMDTTLILGDARVRVEGGARVYAEGGRDVAELRLDGDTLVVAFEAPKAGDGLDRVARFYAPVAGRDGWLEFRRPATRDPRPSLEADLGGILGQAAYERRQTA